MATRQRPALAALALGLFLGSASPTPVAAEAPVRRADFQAEAASLNATRVADWVVASGDNRGMAFVIVDKVAAKIFVFHPDGRLAGASPVLLGSARGDNSVPGIGDRPLSKITPAERTTPAGRFVASMGNDLGPLEIVWVDYDAAISLHRVVTGVPAERRLQRLASVTVLDNRISYGCINAPAAFFDKVIKPAFTGADGIIYILPEVRPLADVFPGIEPSPDGVIRQGP